MAQFVMQGKKIDWLNGDNIEIVKRAFKKTNTVIGAAKILGIPTQNLSWVLNNYIPSILDEVRKKKKNKRVTPVKSFNEFVFVPEIRPLGAQYYIDGMFFKIGNGERVLRHDGFEWVSSTRSLSDIKRASKSGAIISGV